MTKKRVDLRGQQRDQNEVAIIASLCAAGCYVQQMDKSAGFDLLVCFREKIYLIEIKNTDGKNYTYRRLLKMLTDNERTTMLAIEQTGVEYYIVTDAAAALAVVGIDTSAKTE